MRWLILASFLCFVVSCGDVECSKEDRTGTYFLTFQTIDGTCPDQQSAVVSGSTSSPTPADCEKSNETWSEDECDYSVNLFCIFSADDLNMLSVSQTTQEDSDGDHLTGIMTMTIRQHSTGAFVCSGSYEMDAQRQ